MVRIILFLFIQHLEYKFVTHLFPLRIKPAVLEIDLKKKDHLKFFFLVSSVRAQIIVYTCFYTCCLGFLAVILEVSDRI